MGFCACNGKYDTVTAGCYNRSNAGLPGFSSHLFDKCSDRSDQLYLDDTGDRVVRNLDHDKYYGNGRYSHG